MGDEARAAVSTRTNPVNWFEIAVNDLNRAKAFYEKVFDTSLSPLEAGPIKMAWFPRPENAQGSSGGLIQASGRSPSRAGTVVFFSVPSIDATLTKVNQLGGKTVMPKTGGGEHGSVAHFEDCEGNLVALYSDK